MDHRRYRPTLHIEIRENHLVDAVEVPLVVRRHLVDPLGHAVVRIAGEDGHRPGVVARTLVGVPGRGIAGPVVDQVERRIVGIPAPRRAAADLPLVAFPGRRAGIDADRLAEMGGVLRIHQRLRVGTGGERPPGFRAVGKVQRDHVALHAELTAGDAADDEILHDHRSVRAGLGSAHVACDDLPDFFAGVGIQRDDRRVGLVEDDEGRVAFTRRRVGRRRG